MWLPMEQSFDGRQLEDFFRYEFMTNGDLFARVTFTRSGRSGSDGLTPGDLVERLNSIAQRARLASGSWPHSTNQTLPFVRLSRASTGGAAKPCTPFS